MRKSKLITVQFDDGEQTLTSSVKIKCNATGQVKGFYTPYLVKLIKRKYNNNYKEFIDTYVSKGNKLPKPENADDTPDLRLYRSALQLEYDSLSNKPRSTKRNHRISQIVDIFSKRFPDEHLQ